MPTKEECLDAAANVFATALRELMLEHDVKVAA